METRAGLVEHGGVRQSSTAGRRRAAVSKQAVVFDDVVHLLGHEVLPAMFTVADHPQYFCTEDVEEGEVIQLDVTVQDGGIFDMINLELNPTRNRIWGNGYMFLHLI